MTYKQRSNTNLRPKMNTKPFYFVVYILVLVLAILYLDKANAATCVSFDSSNYVQANGQSIEQCSTDLVALSKTEYLAIQSAIQDSGFDPVAYDLAFEGIIRMFVVGFGIGAVIAMVMKLRR